MAKRRIWVAAIAVAIVVSTVSTAFFAHAKDASSSSDGTTVGSARASESVRGMLISQNHRLVVMSLSESLAYIAEKQNLVSALGSEARATAKKETGSIDEVVEAIQKMATRGTVTRFLLGGDSEHLTLLKRELANLHTTLDALEEMRTIAESNTDRAILATQIRSLEKHYMTLEKFVNKHEGLRGLFNKSSKTVRSTVDEEKVTVQL